MTHIIEKQISPVDMQSRQDILIRSGDTVRVHQKIAEKNKFRIQIFEGIVIAVKHGNEPGATFTVRRVGSDGVAVEKIYPLYSSMIDAIEVVRRAKMRRARLYFLRSKTSKQIREKLRRAKLVSEKTTIESKKNKEEVETIEGVVENNMEADSATDNGADNAEDAVEEKGTGEEGGAKNNSENNSESNPTPEEDSDVKNEAVSETDSEKSDAK